jgi:hypothetical protein
MRIPDKLLRRLLLCNAANSEPRVRGHLVPMGEGLGDDCCSSDEARLIQHGHPSLCMTLRPRARRLVDASLLVPVQTHGHRKSGFVVDVLGKRLNCHSRRDLIELNQN